MRLTRNTIAILALASVTFAFAGETKMGAMHHETSSSESKDRKDCESCKGCAVDAQKTPPSKEHETAPAKFVPMSDYLS